MYWLNCSSRSLGVIAHGVIVRKFGGVHGGDLAAQLGIHPGQHECRLLAGPPLYGFIAIHGIQEPVTAKVSDWAKEQMDSAAANGLIADGLGGEALGEMPSIVIFAGDDLLARLVDEAPLVILQHMPEALCVQLMNRYEDERRGKLEQRTQLTAQLEATQEDEQATDEWLAVIRDYAQLR